MIGALQATANEAWKGLLIRWSYKFNIVVETAMIAFIFIGISFFMGDGELDPVQLAPALVGYVIWFYALIAISNMSWGLREETQTGTLEQLYLSPYPVWLPLLGQPGFPLDAGEHGDGLFQRLGLPAIEGGIGHRKTGNECAGRLFPNVVPFQQLRRPRIRRAQGVDGALQEAVIGQARRRVVLQRLAISQQLCQQPVGCQHLMPASKCRAD
jgi:hypothetical protein